jgi:hypothetical protein
MDEEEIIRRRDGVASSDNPLAPDDRRALADARLRALAFALGGEQSARGEAGEVSDTDLLAYLLDGLAPDSRQRLEHAARGDGHIFSRLMTLRSALDAQPDQRDRRHAEDVTRAIRRHIASRIQIRQAGERLQFKERPVLGEHPRLERSAFRAEAAERAVLAYSPAFPKSKRPQLRSDRRPEAEFLDVLERARSLLDAGGYLIDKMEALLEGPQGTGRREGSQSPSDDLWRRGEIERVREQLTELQHQIQIIAETTCKIMASGSVEAASRTESSFLETPELMGSDDLRLAILKSLVDETWADAVDVQAGPWGVNLSGITHPTPQLRVAV